MNQSSAQNYKLYPEFLIQKDLLNMFLIFEKKK